MRKKHRTLYLGRQSCHTIEQWCPNKKPKGPHSIGAKNSSIQNLWKILRPKGPVGPAGPVMNSTALEGETTIQWQTYLGLLYLMPPPNPRECSLAHEELINSLLINSLNSTNQFSRGSGLVMKLHRCSPESVSRIAGQHLKYLLKLIS